MCLVAHNVTFPSLFRSLQTSLSDEIVGLPNLEDLGVKAGTVGEKMPREFMPYKCVTRFGT